MSDPKCTASEAVQRALTCVAAGRGQYVYGAGDYRPGPQGDYPWTLNNNHLGSDCAGFAICWAWKLVRHRPGYNHGWWASVADDINCNSLIEDSNHAQELSTDITGDIPGPGDLLTYPTFNLQYSPGKLLTFIGHVGIVVDVSPRYVPGRYDLLSIAQCHGPNGFTPGAVRTDGSIWAHHDTVWPRPEHRTHLIHMKERV